MKNSRNHLEQLKRKIKKPYAEYTNTSTVFVNNGTYY